MKTLNRALLTMAALAFSFSLQAQYVGATLLYVKVKPGQQNNYLELEKTAKKLHQARVEKGVITRWALYKKMYNAKEDPYDYILVALNDDFKKTRNEFPKELIDATYTKEEQDAFMKKAGQTRNIVQTEYYDRVATSDEYKPYKYLRFIRYYVEPGSRWKFENSRKETFKPLFDEVIKQGYHAGWSLWKKDPNDKNFQYVAVNTFAEYGDWKSDFPGKEIFKAVFPDKDMDETVYPLLDLRTQVNAEYWELVISTDPLDQE